MFSLALAQHKVKSTLWESPTRLKCESIRGHGRVWKCTYRYIAMTRRRSGHSTMFPHLLGRSDMVGCKAVLQLPWPTWLASTSHHFPTSFVSLVLPPHNNTYCAHITCLHTHTHVYFNKTPVLNPWFCARLPTTFKDLSICNVKARGTAWAQ